MPTVCTLPYNAQCHYVYVHMSKQKKRTNKQNTNMIFNVNPRDQTVHSSPSNTRCKGKEQSYTEKRSWLPWSVIILKLPTAWNDITSVCSRLTAIGAALMELYLLVWSCHCVCFGIASASLSGDAGVMRVLFSV